MASSKVSSSYLTAVGSFSGLEGAQGGAGVGGEEGVAGAAGDEGDAAALEHLHGVVTHVVLRDGFHGRSRKDLGVNAFFLDEHGEGEGVDDRGEHAHLVAVHAVEALPDALQAAEDVAAAVDDGDLEAGFRGGRDFFCVGGQAFRVQALSGRAAEAFAAEFEKDSLVHGLSVWI